jgi:hypothetical protein
MLLRFCGISGAPAYYHQSIMEHPGLNKDVRHVPRRSTFRPVNPGQKLSWTTLYFSMQMPLARRSQSTSCKR